MWNEGKWRRGLEGYKLRCSFMEVVNGDLRSGVHFVQEMMGHTVPFLQRCLCVTLDNSTHFCSGNVQSVVHLHSIRVDNLPIKPMCQLYRQLRFPHTWMSNRRESRNACCPDNEYRLVPFHRVDNS